MSKITNLDDHRPHISIRTKDAVHVVPVAMIENIICGGLKLTDVDDWEPMIKAILEEWLEVVG